MKKVVPFTKQIPFNRNIAEVTDISVSHDLELKDLYEIEGNIILDGKYKMTNASQIEEEFNYKLPFVIAIDPKYITDNIEIAIDDFNYEIINEESLKVKVEISLDNIEEKELVRNDIEQFKMDDIIEQLEIKEEPKEEVEEETNNLGSIFSNLTSNEETFSTYNVYIVREADTIEKILDKYNISREELADYNDLDDVSIGSKLIIPCSND